MGFCDYEQKKTKKQNKTEKIRWMRRQRLGNTPPSMFQDMLTTKASIIKSQIGINQEQTVNAPRKS